jgi:hypothetical protein
LSSDLLFVFAIALLLDTRQRLARMVSYRSISYNLRDHRRSGNRSRAIHGLLTSL